MTSADVQMKVIKMMREKYLLRSCSRNQKKAKKEEEGNEHLGNDLVDIILDNDKYKEKLLLATAKNIKNSQNYHKVIEELKERCCERGEELTFNVK